MRVKHEFIPIGTGEDKCGVCGWRENDTMHHRLDTEEPDLKVINRISREQMLLEIIEIVRKRSTCLRGKVGVVIVKSNRIVSMGYNGSPPGAPHCFDLGCDVDEDNHDAGCQRTVHAEANAISFAAREGVSTKGATMYSTHAPCLKCAQLIVTCGIAEFIYVRDYRAERLDVLGPVVVRKVE